MRFFPPVLRLLYFFVAFFAVLSLSGQAPPAKITQPWLAEHLAAEHPRLIFTKEAEELLKEKIATDVNVRAYYDLVKDKADEALELPLLSYKTKGRRLLYLARSAVNRNLALAMAYRIEKDPKYLKRLEEEILNLCQFSDWNHSHFLDAAEMSVAVGLPYDWVYEALSAETKKAIETALVENAVKPSIAENPSWNWWWDVYFNWNPVCHGGLTIAALAIYEEEPHLSSFVLNRMYEHFPKGFIPYYPDGAYNEGPSYWFYATNYIALTLAACETALGTSFDFENAKGFKESLVFMEETAGPSGDYFNYFDATARGYRNLSHNGLLAWFAPKVGLNYLADSLSLQDNWEDYSHKSMNRFSSVHAIFLAQMPQDLPKATVPQAWLASGDSPVGVLRPQDENGIYLAAKGGSAGDNHGNMDAGSFILEWKKIRWGIDPGNQDYQELEAIIGEDQLWGRTQDAGRWALLTKHNLGHSTLSINGERHLIKGRALVLAADLESETPSFAFDLSTIYGKNVDKAIRHFKKLSESEMQVMDEVTVNENTREIRWSFMTTAEVKLKKGKVLLKQQGEALELSMESPMTPAMEVNPLDPPPLEYDKQIEGLKRVDFVLKLEGTESRVLEMKMHIRGLQ